MTTLGVNSVRRSIRRAIAKVRPYRVIAIAWIVLPVPLLVSHEWWLAPPWMGLVVVSELYVELGSVALTILFAAGILIQTAIWTAFAGKLWLRARRSPQARLTVALAHPVTLWIFMVLLVHASLRPTFLIGGDRHRHWVTLLGLF